MVIAVFCLVAAAALRELSVGGVLLWVVNLVVGLAVAVLGALLWRLIAQNDRAHAALDGRLDKLAATLSAEKDARADADQGTGDRVWQLAGEVKEHYQTRHEGMRLYGTLMRTVNANHRELLDEVKGLPCKAPARACPTAGAEGEAP